MSVRSSKDDRIREMAEQIEAFHTEVRSWAEADTFESPEIYDLHRKLDDFSNTAHYLYNPEYH